MKWIIASDIHGSAYYCEKLLEKLTEKAKELSKAFEKLTQDEFSDVAAIKIGPFKEGIYRIGGRYREKLIIKYKDSRRCRELFMKLLTECAGRNSKGAALIDIDVNPTTV